MSIEPPVRLLVEGRDGENEVSELRVSMELASLGRLGWCATFGTGRW